MLTVVSPRASFIKNKKLLDRYVQPREVPYLSVYVAAQVEGYAKIP